MKKSLFSISILFLMLSGPVLADEVSVEDDLNRSIKDFMEPFARKEYAGGIDPQFLIGKSNEIMKNIYNDILKIKDRYEELQGFGEKNYKEGRRVSAERKCYGYCPPWELAEIESCIRIDFSEEPFGRGWSMRPYLQVYIKDIKHHLSFLAFWVKDAQLKNEVVKIIRKNLKDFKTKVIISPR